MSAFDRLQKSGGPSKTRRMAQEFAGSRLDRESGIIMVVATTLALLAGFTLGPPSTTVVTIVLIFLLPLVAVFFGAWTVRLSRVGRIGSHEYDSIAPHLQRPIRLFLTFWLGLAGASMILFIAGLISLPTGIATNAVVSALVYVVAISIICQCVGGTLTNVAIVRSASEKDPATSR